MPAAAGRAATRTARRPAAPPRARRRHRSGGNRTRDGGDNLLERPRGGRRSHRGRMGMKRGRGGLTPRSRPRRRPMSTDHWIDLCQTGGLCRRLPPLCAAAFGATPATASAAPGRAVTARSAVPRGARRRVVGDSADAIHCSCRQAPRATAPPVACRSQTGWGRRAGTPDSRRRGRHRRRRDSRRRDLDRYGMGGAKRRGGGTARSSARPRVWRGKEGGDGRGRGRGGHRVTHTELGCSICGVARNLMQNQAR